MTATTRIKGPSSMAAKLPNSSPLLQSFDHIMAGSFAIPQPKTILTPCGDSITKRRAP